MTQLSHTILRTMVRSILESPLDHKWSLQGFGMLRLYLPDNTQMHVWDGRFTVPEVSTIHDHPWDFQSYVVSGCVRNELYALPESDLGLEEGEVHDCQTIRCGEGGGLEGDTHEVNLVHMGSQVVSAGEFYRQTHSQIHTSKPRSGTVTIIQRFARKNGDADHARVFWRGGDWVSAEPRTATIEEVAAITKEALTWF